MIPNTLLALQSPFARLDIKNKKAVTSEFQRAMERVAICTDPNVEKINGNISPDDFQISNLPPSVERLPVNSIFSYIKAFHANTPDIRFIKINSPVDVLYRPRGLLNDSMPTTIDKDSMFRRPKIVRSTQPMFVDSIPSLNRGDSYEAGLGDMTINPIYQSTYGLTEPLNITVDQALNIVNREDWTTFVNNLIYPAASLDITKEKIFTDLTILLKVDNVTLDAVLDKTNKTLNDTTVKVGIAYTLIYKTLPESKVRYMSKEKSEALAAIINKAIDDLDENLS